jgi:hypothetical protein
MADDPTSAADLLGRMMGHGVYDIGLVGEFERFGFKLDDNRLSYAGRTEKLYVRGPSQVAVDMANDPSSGMLDSGMPDDARLIDALDLSVAIFKLMAPGETPPSSMYFGRGKGFRANVEAIERLERTHEQTRQANHLN